MSSAINKSEAGGGARPSLLKQMLAVRPIDPVPPGKDRLKQVLSLPALIAIGLGATIGSGIFVLTGTVAANHSGPAITLSLLIAALGGEGGLRGPAFLSRQVETLHENRSSAYVTPYGQKTRMD